MYKQLHTNVSNAIFSKSIHNKEKSANLETTDMDLKNHFTRWELITFSPKPLHKIMIVYEFKKDF